MFDSLLAYGFIFNWIQAEFLVFWIEIQLACLQVLLASFVLSAASPYRDVLFPPHLSIYWSCLLINVMKILYK